MNLLEDISIIHFDYLKEKNTSCFHLYLNLFVISSGFFTAIMDHFHWKHVAIIFDNIDPLMRLQGDAIRTALREDPRYPRPYDIEFSTTKNPNFKAMMEEASQHARGLYHMFYYYSIHAVTNA